MQPCFESSNSRGHAENLYQTSVNSHTLKIQSITPSNNPKGRLPRACPWVSTKKSVIASPPPADAAISSLQQPKPHFVRSAKSLPINSPDLHTRSPPGHRPGRYWPTRYIFCERTLSRKEVIPLCPKTRNFQVNGFVCYVFVMCYCLTIIWRRNDEDFRD